MMSCTVNNIALMMTLLIHRTYSNKAPLYPVSQRTAEDWVGCSLAWKTEPSIKESV